MTRPNPPLERANIARAEARRYRGQWLVYLAEGNFGPLELLLDATTDDGAPLKKLKLSKVLGSQPGWGPVTIRRVLDTFGRLAQVSNEERADMTVGYVVHPLSQGHRLAKFAKALTINRDDPVYLGFPWADRPTPKAA